MKKILNIFIIIIAFSIATSAQEIGIEIGNIAPNIKLANPQGDTISLHSLRGSLVLIDFWASWCGPCRKENPTLVKAYNQYKDKNFIDAQSFTIYGVSLDKKLESWKKGILDDGLVWHNVSELKAWASDVAKVYNIKSIPSNLLINGKGVIVGKNIRGNALLEKLETLTTKDPLIEFESDLNKLYLKYNLLKEDDKYANKQKSIQKIEKTLNLLKKIVKELKNS